MPLKACFEGLFFLAIHFAPKEHCEVLKQVLGFCSNTANGLDMNALTPLGSIHIHDLPPEVIIQIFHFLPLHELCVITSVCQLWKVLSYDNLLWKAVCLRENLENDGNHLWRNVAATELCAVRALKRCLITAPTLSTTSGENDVGQDYRESCGSGVCEFWNYLADIPARGPVCFTGDGTILRLAYDSQSYLFSHPEAVCNYTFSRNYFSTIDKKATLRIWDLSEETFIGAFPNYFKTSEISDTRTKWCCDSKTLIIMRYNAEGSPLHLHCNIEVHKLKKPEISFSFTNKGLITSTLLQGEVLFLLEYEEITKTNFLHVIDLSDLVSQSFERKIGSATDFHQVVKGFSEQLYWNKDSFYILSHYKKFTFFDHDPIVIESEFRQLERWHFMKQNPSNSPPTPLPEFRFLD